MWYHDISARIVVGLFLWSLYSSTAFAFVITEIMYDPSGADGGYEWIEVLNDSEESIDLSQLLFRESDTSHALKPEQEGGSTILPPQSYGIIADVPSSFREHFSNFQDLLIDSAFSLSNTGETLEVLDKDGTVLTVASYDPSQGAKGDGNSLNRTESTFVPRTPTPGKPISEDILRTASSSSKKLPKAVPYVYTYKDVTITAEFKQDMEAFVDIPYSIPFTFSLQPAISSYSVRWNFGDGTTGQGIKPHHTYVLPGTYTISALITLKNMKSTYNLKPMIVKSVVTVSPQPLTLHLYTINNEQIARIANSSHEEIDVSGFSLRDSSEHVFTFPPRAFLAPRSSSLFSIKKTQASLELWSPDTFIIVSEQLQVLNSRDDLLKLLSLQDEETSSDVRGQLPESSSINSDSSDHIVWKGLITSETEQASLKNMSLLQEQNNVSKESSSKVNTLSGFFGNQDEMARSTTTSKEARSTFPWRALMLLLGTTLGMILTSLSSRPDDSDSNSQSGSPHSSSETLTDRYQRRLKGEWRV